MILGAVAIERCNQTTKSNFDDLITDVLSRFASGTNCEFAADIQTSLREIAEYLGADYAHVVQTSADLASWSVAYEWCSPLAPSQIANHQQVPMGSWSWSEQVLLGGQLLRIDRMDNLPPEAAEVGEQLRSLGFRSTLQVPTHGPGGNVNGCVALSTVVQEVSWADRDVQRLRLVAEAMANAIERSRVEKELQESEWRYRATFQRAPVAILNMTRDGQLLRVNQRFCEMLGYSHEEVIGSDYWDFTDPDDLHPTAALFEKLFVDRDSPNCLEKRYRCKNGDMAWGNLTLSRLSDDEAHHEIVIAVIEDITARKQAEAELQSALRDVEQLTERLREENLYLQEEIVSTLGFEEIIGESEPLRSALGTDRTCGCHRCQRPAVGRNRNGKGTFCPSNPPTESAQKSPVGQSQLGGAAVELDRE